MESVDHLTFRKELEKDELGPLWEDILEMVTKEPVHEVEPYLWKWETIRKHVMESANVIVPGSGAERRVVYLQNPSLKKKGLIGYGTHTLYAGIQLLLPGEVAPSHRHSQAAIRFIIEGNNAYTSVNGEKTYMERGDLILTPPWTWHDHGHEGTEPMIWMDGLDVGLIRSLAGSFYEKYPEDTYPLEKPDNFSAKKYANGSFKPVTETELPVMAYKWTHARQSLENMVQFEADPYDGYAIEYINPLTGGPADARIGTMMQKLTPGMKTKRHRHLHSAIYHVLDGEGYTIINDQKFEWSKGDFFVLPPWSWHEHANMGSQDAHLFSINDRPILDLLGLERKEG